jgi:hypothetical protein
MERIPYQSIVNQWTVHGMNKSYFYLTLDTKPPKINIYSPLYVITGYYFDFRVEVNESISKIEAFIIDNSHNQLQVTLHKNGDHYDGLVDTFGLDLDIAKISITMYDDVHNKGTTEKVFKILPNIINEVRLKYKVQTNLILYKPFKQYYRGYQQNVRIRTIIRNNLIVYKKYKLKIERKYMKQQITYTIIKAGD